MDPKDKKEIAELMGKVIDAKVTPRLERLETGQKNLETGQKNLAEQNKVIIEQVVQNSEDIEMVKIDVKEMQEDVADANFTSQRIESKLNTVIKDQDAMSDKNRQLNRRVLHLESKKA